MQRRTKLQMGRCGGTDEGALPLDFLVLRWSGTLGPGLCLGLGGGWSSLGVTRRVKGRLVEHVQLRRRGRDK